MKHLCSKILAAAGVSMAGVLAAPAAAAFAATTPNVTPFAFSLSPTTVGPGGDVALGVSGCDAGSAQASSTIFPKTDLPSTGTKGEYVGAVTLGTAVAAGTYAVTFTCGNSSGTSNLTVTAAAKTATGATPSTSTMPAGAPKTGVGGSITSGSATLVEAGVGATVVALGVGAFALRRGRREQA